MTVASSAQSLTREGQAVRRVVTLVEPVADLIVEYDRREVQATEQQVSSNSEQRTYRAYEKLIQWCPSVHKLVCPAGDAATAGFEVALACKELQKGADGARGDDGATLKAAIAQWLNESRPAPDPPFSSWEKHGRGFNHDITGKLLCPVDYDWSNADIRSAIREFQPDFHVTAHSWPSFLYADGDYDPTRPAKGLFKGKYLVMVSNIVAKCTELLRHSGMVRCTSTASSCTQHQLRFALSSCSSWVIVDEDFNHEEFYHNIVDYFELPSSPQKVAELDDLLMWWNQRIFGRQNTAHYQPQPVDSLSVSLSRRA
ncbi:hypothetical protein EDD15DRAFT_2152885 [Pisolithus albus]|nr:hypothetical protein EDD15DRAFT_2152885 [Pisolithus albus]